MRSIPMLALGALGALLASAAPAAADQCAKNPTAIAEKAAALVKKGANVLEFCEPCGDRAPGPGYVVRTVEVRDGELIVNGAGVDLAYLFVRTGPDERVNVGVQTACGASDVSEAIRGGKPTGPVKRPRPSSPHPLPPPSPRATSPAELAGTWNVRLTTRYSSCTVAAAPAFAEWTLAYDGALDASAPSSLFRATLKPRRHPSGAAIQLSMFLKDRFSGWIITSVRTRQGSDPVCVIYQDVSATRR